MAADRMSAVSDGDCRVFDTPEQLARAAADWIVERAENHAQRFTLCLSGGTTPKRVYELLGEVPRRDRFPWRQTHWFWGDERVVPHGDARSNFHMASEALLRHVPVPPANIHAIPTEQGSPAGEAAAYEAMLKRFYGAAGFDPARPLFDLTLLGLGEDGHIASLFPGSPALAETKRWAVPVAGPDGLERITLTFPALTSSAVIAFLVAGERKREALARARAGDPALPAARLRPHGAVHWFADRAAAAMAEVSGV
jgi:6-phosphogluconolactonase